LSDRKGIRPVKTEWWGTGMVVCLEQGTASEMTYIVSSWALNSTQTKPTQTSLEQGADLHIAQLMPLPLTVSCFSKIQIGFTFLVLAHPGSPDGPLNRCVFLWLIIS